MNKIIVRLNIEGDKEIKYSQNNTISKGWFAQCPNDATKTIKHNKFYYDISKFNALNCIKNYYFMLVLCND